MTSSNEGKPVLGDSATFLTQMWKIGRCIDPIPEKLRRFRTSRLVYTREFERSLINKGRLVATKLQHSRSQLPALGWYGVDHD